MALATKLGERLAAATRCQQVTEDAATEEEFLLWLKVAGPLLEEDLFRAAKSGQSSYMTDPFAPDKLMPRISQWFGGQGVKITVNAYPIPGQYFKYQTKYTFSW